MKRRLWIEFIGSELQYKQLKEFIEQHSDTMHIAEELAEDKVIIAKELKIDPEKRQVIFQGKLIGLTAREFDILLFFASHPGHVFSHQQIYEAVWKDECFLDAANITAHIGHIRKKIEPNSKCPMYIQTVRGAGYKFMECE